MIPPSTPAFEMRDAEFLGRDGEDWEVAFGGRNGEVVSNGNG